MWCEPRTVAVATAEGRTARMRASPAKPYGTGLCGAPVRFAHLFGTTKPHSPKPQRSIPHRPVAPAQGCSEVPSACGTARSQKHPITPPRNPSLRSCVARVSAAHPGPSGTDHTIPGALALLVYPGYNCLEPAPSPATTPATCAVSDRREKSIQSVASAPWRVARGAQEPQCTLKCMRIASTTDARQRGAQ